MVEHLASGRTLLEGYALFFIGTSLLGVPALVLCILLSRRTRASSARPDRTEEGRAAEA
jgi:PAT family beta-lactamase induction signal transducer AmpG